MKPGKEKTINLSRREFIKKSSASALGISLLGSLPAGFLAGLPAGISASILRNNFISKSKLVMVRHSKVIDQNGDVNNSILAEMLQTALTNFSGEKSASAYWSKLFSPKDIIGLKVSTLGLAGISRSSSTNHFAAITNTIIQSSKDAGMKEENFIIWDRSDEELINAGFSIQKEIGKTRVLSSLGSRGENDGAGFSDQEFTVGEKTTRLSKLLHEMCAGIINIPVMKNHQNSGFTGALKNNYGSISNAREFHNNNCTNPGIPEINALPAIRNKQRLIIADLLMSVFGGGPRWDRRFMWPHGGILIGTDPVAVDTVMLDIINEKRKTENMPVISENIARHIKLSKELGLGTNNLDEIDLVKINLG